MADQGEGNLMPEKPNKKDAATKKVQEMSLTPMLLRIHQFRAVQSCGLFYSARILLNNSDSLVGVAIANFEGITFGTTWSTAVTNQADATPKVAAATKQG